MGRFFDAIQKDEVIGPLRRGFKTKDWNHAYKTLGEDEKDESLHQIGLIILAKANEIRSNLTVASSENINKTTKLRSFIAVLNYNNCALRRKTHETFKSKEKNENLIMVHELVEMKLKLQSGANFSPDEIIQSMVDGAQVPIKFILSNAGETYGNPDYSNLNWPNVISDFNLGILYSHIEAIWDDCLWNDFRVIHERNQIIFSPETTTWESRLVASQFRTDNLNMQFLNQAYTTFSRTGEKKLKELIGIRNVKSLLKVGRKQVISFEQKSNLIDIAIPLFAARLYASEPYYRELLSEPQNHLCGASLDDLLRAWAIVSNIAIILRDNLYSVDITNKPESWFQSYAPIIQIDVLVKAISTELSIKLSQANAIVKFLTFEAKKGQELWAQPLIPVSEKSLAPLFSAAIAPNLRRIIDVWLKQLDVDMSRRGPAFENHINEFIKSGIGSSAFLKNAMVLPKGLKFRPSNDREEQIDTVFAIDDLVIMGESKCIRQPSEAKEFAMHRKTVIDASSQIRRKAISAERNRKEFHHALSEQGIQVPQDFKILPIVILSGSIHAGFEVDDVPIVDEYILNVFFQGELIDFALRHSNGNMEHIKKRIIYTSYNDAAKIAPAYFRSPPQMEAFVKGIKPRWIPIVNISEKDWEGIYLTFECKLDIDNEIKEFTDQPNENEEM